MSLRSEGACCLGDLLEFSMEAASHRTTTGIQYLSASFPAFLSDPPISPRSSNKIKTPVLMRQSLWKTSQTSKYRPCWPYCLGNLVTSGEEAFALQGNGSLPLVCEVCVDKWEQVCQLHPLASEDPLAESRTNLDHFSAKKRQF